MAHHTLDACAMVCVMARGWGAQSLGLRLSVRCSEAKRRFTRASGRSDTFAGSHGVVGARLEDAQHGAGKQIWNDGLGSANWRWRVCEAGL